MLKHFVRNTLETFTTLLSVFFLEFSFTTRVAIPVDIDYKNYTQANGKLGNKCTDQFLMLNQLKMRVETTRELCAKKCDKMS